MQHESRVEVPPDHHVDLSLRPGEDAVIAGTMSASGAPPVPFHGWLELMDALEKVWQSVPGTHPAHALRRPG